MLSGRSPSSIGLRNTSASVCEIVSPSNSRLFESISCSITPNDQMSARRSVGWPEACSGDMYAAVPRINPATVPADVTVAERIGSLAVAGS